MEELCYEKLLNKQDLTIHPSYLRVVVRDWPHKFFILDSQKPVHISLRGFWADNHANSPSVGSSLCCETVFDLHSPDSIEEIKNRLRWCVKDADECTSCKYWNGNKPL